MTQAILLFLGAGAVLIVAATFLTRAADEVAERTGIGRV
jgi:Ca2+/Na+ antiporter